MLDLVGPVVADNVNKSRWNALLIRRICAAAASVVKGAKHPKRFGNDYKKWRKISKWEKVVKDKLYDVFRIVCSLFPRSGENEVDVEERLKREHLASISAKTLVHIRSAVGLQIDTF